MTLPLIEVRNLSKSYRLGSLSGSTFRSELARRWRGEKEPEENLFQALRGISFDVREGEVLGVIGRNGAGKSTLLKILSRITEPTGGEAILRGRVASLLEVGTGFHPDLTGRENIYLNGAILGMRRREIALKMDDIIAFSGLEKFVDTPVKRYSSGMFVRLAFAVGAFLDSEILIVDEVLAVGDLGFQQKCLQQMEQTARSGRTVLFVSHNMAAIRSHCSRALLLRDGVIATEGGADETTRAYEELFAPQEMASGPALIHEDGSLVLENLSWSPDTPRNQDAWEAELTLRCAEPVHLSELQLVLHSSSGIRMTTIDFRATGRMGRLLERGTWKFRASIPFLALSEGRYRLSVYVQTAMLWKDLPDLAVLQVAERAQRGDPLDTRMNPGLRGVMDLAYTASAERTS